jgi:hypothetical protein
MHEIPTHGSKGTSMAIRGSVFEMNIKVDTADAVNIAMKGIEGKMKLYYERDDYAAGQTDCQPEDINRRIDLVTQEVT